MTIRVSLLCVRGGLSDGGGGERSEEETENQCVVSRSVINIML